MVFAFCFQVYMWLPHSAMGTQPLKLKMSQPFGVHPWQAYVPPGNGQWPTPGVH